MAVKWKSQSKEVLVSWVKALQESAVITTLDDWEQHFVASMDWQLNKFGKLTQAQQEKLEEIYAARTK